MLQTILQALLSRYERVALSSLEREFAAIFVEWTGINTVKPANKVRLVILGVNVVHLRVFLWLQIRHSIHRDYLCDECKAEIRGQRPLEPKQLLLRARHSTTMQKGDCRHEHKILQSKKAIVATSMEF